MSYRQTAIDRAARALQGVTDMTNDWGTFGNIVQTRPDPGTEAFALEFALMRTASISASTAVGIAEAVAAGGVAAGYSWDVYGVLVRKGETYPVVQVVFQFSDWTLAGGMGDIIRAVNESVVRSGLAEATSDYVMIRLTAPESRYFSQQGGLAPLVVTEGKKVALTKAAVSPSSKQVMSGDVRNLSAASPLSTGQAVAAAAAEAPWGLILGLGLLGAGVLFLSGYLKPGLRPNGALHGRRRRQDTGFVSAAMANRYMAALKRMGLEAKRGRQQGRTGYPARVIYSGTPSQMRKAQALYMRSYDKKNDLRKSRRMSRNGSDESSLDMLPNKRRSSPRSKGRLWNVHAYESHGAGRKKPPARSVEATKAQVLRVFREAGVKPRANKRVDRWSYTAVVKPALGKKLMKKLSRIMGGFEAFVD